VAISVASWDTWLEEKEETRSSMERLMVRGVGGEDGSDWER
jgi:hypothetical protein